MRPLRRAAFDLVMAFVAVLLLVVPLVASCAPEPAVPQKYTTTSCAEGCTNARARCGEETLKPKTGTCEDVCLATETNGGNFRTGCLSAAATCEAVKACSR